MDGGDADAVALKGTRRIVIKSLRITSGQRQNESVVHDQTTVYSLLLFCILHFYFIFFVLEL
jgi:hypothetical protein